MEINKLEQEAKLRQEKLKNLKRRRDDKTDGGRIPEKPTNEDSKSVLPKPKFRSYKPQDENLVQQIVNKAEPSNVNKDVKDLLDLAKSEMVIDQLDIASLAPRKPDWDLKRDVEKKLEKLARRTQKAMAEIIREKLKEKQDLAEVNSAPIEP